MNIFILEDDLFQRKSLENIINNFNFKIDHLFATGKPNNLIDCIESQDPCNLYFLDVDIKNEPKKGLDVAKAIREKDEVGAIVFVTSHLEFATLTYSYKVSALDFISKTDPQFETRIKESLEYVRSKQNDQELDDPFIFENKARKIKIPFSDILYFETSNKPHQVILISKKRRTEFMGKLSDLEKLDDRLYRCHKSFLINLDNVIEVDKKNLTVHFANEEKALVSRRKLKALLDR